MGVVSATILSMTFCRLSHREAADGEAVETDIDQRASTILAQCEIVAALHDAEQSIAVAPAALEGAFAALAPT